MAHFKPRTARHKSRVFTVAWDDRRGRYIAADENGDDLGVSTDFNKAVGSAVREADLASKAGVQVSVKVQQKGGKLRTEYVAQPLKH
jgi:hypothetical protein